MSDEEREKMRAWVENWKEIGPLVEALRIKEIRSADLEEAILSMDDAFRSATFLSPASKTSGLVEFHAILARSK